MSKRKTKTKAQQKQRKAKFQQTMTVKKNQVKSMQNAYMNHMIERQEIVKRANLIEQIYKAKSVFSTIVDGVLQLNENMVYEKENILYWKNDDNPIMAGLDAFENYNKYSKEFVNMVLGVIQKQTPQTTTEVDLSGFELVEDDTIEIK